MLQSLAAQARRAGAVLLPITGTAMRDRLAAALDDAAHRQDLAPGYAAELQLWTRRYPGGRDGVPAASVAPPPTGLLGPSPLRRFPRAQLDQPHQSAGHGTPDDAAELLVVVSSHDGPVDRLRAGEATSAVLLAATRMGLASTPLSQAMEVAATRDAIQTVVLHAPEHPQLIVRDRVAGQRRRRATRHPPARPALGPAARAEPTGRLRHSADLRPRRPWPAAQTCRD